MAQFIGYVQGSGAKASRTGTKKSGLEITAASYQGSVTVILSHNPETGEDKAVVSLDKWKGAGTSKLLYIGPVAGGGKVLPNPADVVVNDLGSIVGFMPVSEEAKTWFEDNIEAESWQWLGGYLNVEARFADDLIEGIEATGMKLIPV